MARPTPARPLAAIDVGTNAVRLEIARPLPDGSLELLHQERDPVRPGEGVFATGSLPATTADRLLATLRRYGALARRFHARVRAVATSAVREARNRDEVVQRARDEAGIELEVISGREEARLIALGVLHGQAPGSRSLVIDIGGGSTEVIDARGERPDSLWSVGVGAVRLTELFESSGKVGERKLELLRSFAAEAFREALPSPGKDLPRAALGSSGTIQALVAFAAPRGSTHATAAQLSRAVEKLAAMRPEQRRRVLDPKRAEIIVAGAVVLESVMRHLRVQSVAAVDRGLRDGLLVDLLRRARPGADDTSLRAAALALGHRFGVDEGHALQVDRLALALFDQLARLHALPASTRPLLETAALLHDVGNAVSYRNHHKHSAYLIQHADLPGLTDAERALAALVARFHRRSPPERKHAALEGLGPADYKLIRRLSTLLRIADSLDRSHQQPVRAVTASERRGAVELRIASPEPLDLELWDLEHEQGLFQKVFGKPLEVVVARA